MEFESSIKELIAKKGIDKNYGARPLRRTIQNLVEDSLAEEILEGKLPKGKIAKVGIKDGKEVPLNKETECKGKMYADFFYTHPDFGKHAFLSNGKCVNCDATRPNP